MFETQCRQGCASPHVPTTLHLSATTGLDPSRLQVTPFRTTAAELSMTLPIINYYLVTLRDIKIMNLKIVENENGVVRNSCAVRGWRR